MGLYGCIYFSPSRIPVQLPLATQPFAQLPSFLWASSILQKKIVTAVFPYLGPSHIPKPVAEGKGVTKPAQGSPGTREDAAGASDAVA